jgi:hypothetical protein
MDPFIVLAKYPPTARSIAVCSLDCLSAVTSWAVAEAEKRARADQEARFTGRLM